MTTTIANLGCDVIYKPDDQPSTAQSPATAVTSDLTLSRRNCIRLMSHRWCQLYTVIQPAVCHAVLIVFVSIQAVITLQTHSLLAKLTLCNSIFFILATLKCLFPHSPPRLEAFLRLVGFICLEGLTLVTFTHCLEAFFVQHHAMQLTLSFIAITATDIVLKITYLSRGYFPTLDLDWGRQTILHFTAPVSALAIAIVSQRLSQESINSISLIDPCLCILISIIVTPIAISSGMKMIPYMLVNTPTNFDVDEFKKKVTKKFPQVFIEHIHVFRQSPEVGFEALVHYKLFIDCETDNWTDAVKSRIIDVQDKITQYLREAGAQRITIQPRICTLEQEHEKNNIWLSCSSILCEQKNLTCCTSSSKQSLLTKAQLPPVQPPLLTQPASALPTTAAYEAKANAV